jgi:hypothetical protein
MAARLKATLKLLLQPAPVTRQDNLDCIPSQLVLLDGLLLLSWLGVQVCGGAHTNEI